MDNFVLENEYLKVSFQSFGAEVVSIQDKDGIEYLWQGDKAFWGGHSPTLFPICGSIRNDSAYIGDKSINIPRHGIVRKKTFVCKEIEDDSILFEIENDNEMYNQFPFQFKLMIQYTLLGKSITTKYIVENKSEKEMPFFIGGHPGFNCPLFENEAYNDYFLEFSQTENLSVPKPIVETGLIDMGERKEFLKDKNVVELSHELFEIDAVILDSLKSRSVKLCSKSHSKGIQLDFEDFPYLILWSTSNQGKFIALEPWSGLSTCSDESDNFEEKRNVQYVEKNGKKNFSYSISVL